MCYNISTGGFMIELKSTVSNIDGKLFFNEDIWNRIEKIMFEIKNESGFVGKRDRFLKSNISCLITYDNNDVGFIYATQENRYSKGLFVDIVIKKEYRSKGIGKYVLSELSSRCNVYLFGEIEESNVASNKIAEEVGIKILSSDKNYYFFFKEKYNEFLEINKNHDFEKAVLKNALNSNELYNGIINEERIVKIK